MMKHFASFRLKNEMEKIVLFPNTALEEIKCKDEKYIAEYMYSVYVSEGIYASHTYNFRILIPEAYPFRSPTTKCMDPIFHPNVDFCGNVCLEFLRHNWSCAMGIEWVVWGIYLFLIEPCGENALNTEAGDLLLYDYDKFVEKARTYTGS